MDSSPPTSLRLRTYEVLTRPDGSMEELGSGGFSRTFRARHTLLGTEVALKIVHDHLTGDSRVRARFLREVQEQSRLEHPNIAAITYCDDVDGTLFYVMDLCPGGDLLRLVQKRGALSVSEAFHLMAQVAEALKFAHGHGLIHRDVKPSSLLLDFTHNGMPIVRLTDFGLGKRLGPSAELSGGLLSLKSPSLGMTTPEELREQPLDARADLFSLGLTVWCLLEGKPPFEGGAADIIADRLAEAEYESRLPAFVTGQPRAILAKLIRKNRADRYASTDELLADLRPCLEALPLPLTDWRERAGLRGGGGAAGAPTAPPADELRAECRDAGAAAVNAVNAAADEAALLRVSADRLASRLPDAAESLACLREWAGGLDTLKKECAELAQRAAEVPDGALDALLARLTALPAEAEDTLSQVRIWSKQVDAEARRAVERAEREAALQGLQNTLAKPAPSPPPPPPPPPSDKPVELEILLPAARKGPPAPPPPPTGEKPVPPPGKPEANPRVTPSVPAGKRKSAFPLVALLALSAAGAGAWVWWNQLPPGTAIADSPSPAPAPDKPLPPPPEVEPLPDPTPEPQPTPEPEPPTPAPVPTPEPPMPTPAPEPTRLATTITFTGEVPADFTGVKIEGLALDSPPQPAAGGLTLSTSSAAGTPFTVTPPPGYSLVDESPVALSSAAQIELRRLSGGVTWRPANPRFYTTIHFVWEGPLPGESTPVPAETSVSPPIDDGAIRLPTGVWRVSLDDDRGDDPNAQGVIVERREITKLRVTSAGAEISDAAAGPPSRLTGTGYITPGESVLTRDKKDGVKDKVLLFERMRDKPSKQPFCKPAEWNRSGWRYPSPLTLTLGANGEASLEAVDYDQAFRFLLSVYIVIRMAELEKISGFPLYGLAAPGTAEDPADSLGKLRAAVDSVDDPGNAKRMNSLPGALRKSVADMRAEWSSFGTARPRGQGTIKRVLADGSLVLDCRVVVQKESGNLPLTLRPAGDGAWTMTGGKAGFEELSGTLTAAP